LQVHNATLNKEAWKKKISDISHVVMVIFREIGKEGRENGDYLFYQTLNNKYIVVLF